LHIVRYLLKELLPQFFSALIMICSIIIVSQLVRLSEVLVTFGLSLENVFLPFLYIILPFLSLTIPMAYLFAVVLTFGRLSADGEYAALLAAGYPLKRAARTVMTLAVVLYVVAAVCAMNLEAWGRRELVQFFYRKTQTELDNMVKYKMQQGVFLDGFLGYVLYAEKISPDRSQFQNVMLAPGSNAKKANFTMLAPSGNLTGSVETGDLKLSLDHGVAFATAPGPDAKISILKFNKTDIDILRIFREQIIGADAAEDDYRSFHPMELRHYLNVLVATPRRSEEQEASFKRADFLWHTRIASPFAVITFALFGMVLGVGDPRRGKSMAYIGAIVTIMAGYLLMMGFKNAAENGAMKAVLAAWLPNLVLLVFGSFLVYQKNRLPPSENTLDFVNLPFFNRWKKSNNISG